MILTYLLKKHHKIPDFKKYLIMNSHTAVNPIRNKNKLNITLYQK